MLVQVLFVFEASPLVALPPVELPDTLALPVLDDCEVLLTDVMLLVFTVELLVVVVEV